ncbi:MULTISPECIES: PhiH1 repressor [Natrinema]|nr:MULTISPECIES: PhiH1 repressor [Natrinema]AFO56189.1 phage PhiH1 repressor protein [Natrinema sp. J7-2]
MRVSADWMVLADDRILEFLAENGPRSPTKIKEEGPIPFSRQHINNRCMKLEEYGLTQNIGNGVYTITEIGERYLRSELDARELETRSTE